MRGLLVAGVLLVLLLAAASIRVLQISRDLHEAKTELEAASALLTNGQPAAARAALGRGETRVTHANSVVFGSPELSIFNLIPVARQNLAALKDSVGVALRLTGGGRRLLTTARPLEAADGRIEVPLRSGAVPLPVLRLLSPQVDDLQESLPIERDAPHSRFLIGPVRRLVDTVYRQADLRKHQLRVAGDGLTVLEALSGGEGAHRVLLAVANSAEMRGTGGMILSYGELTADKGQFHLEQFGNVDEIALSAPALVDLPRDYLDRFGSLGPSLNWRNANLGADFTYLGPAMQAMYRQSTGKTADSVIQIDSKGLAALLRGTGPVDVPGLGTVTADNVVDLTLSQAYARFADRTTRQEVLGDVAEAVFAKLVTGNYASLRPLATALIDAVAERSIILHMTDPSAQVAVADLGADGRLPAAGPDFAMLTVQNFSANKLDYLLDSAVRLTGSRPPGKLGRVRAEITITNTAAPGQTTPAYVYGPFAAGQTAGQYVGLATLYLPAGAGVTGQSGDLSAGRVQATTEAGRAAVSFPVRVSAGQSQRVVIDLTLVPAPQSGYEFVFVPVSRVRPTRFGLELTGAPRPLSFNGTPTRMVVLKGDG